jgi:hypothetical protein
LLTFLTTEIESRERYEGFRQMPISNPTQRTKITSVEEKKPAERNGAASALSVSSSSQNSCNFCGRPHPSHKCYDVLNLSIGDRKDKFKFSGVCFRCASKKHRASMCNIKCIEGAQGNIMNCCVGQIRAAQSQILFLSMKKVKLLMENQVSLKKIP